MWCDRNAIDTAVLVAFPGDHGGFASHPKEFAATLIEVLDAAG
jgi:hypothetical protein